MHGGYEVVDEDHVGGREHFLSEWKTIRAVFHNFEELPSERGHQTESKVLKCHGLEWQIQLFPGGDSNSSEEDVFVSIFLSSMSCTSTNKIRAKYRIRVPSAGRSAGNKKFDIFSPEDSNDVANESQDWGHDIVKRNVVLKASNNCLVDKKLTVEVDIQVVLDKPPTWTPTNTISADMLKLLDDTDNADVLFDIAQDKKGKKQNRKQESRAFYAHRNILSVRCPALAELAEVCDPKTPIPIGDVQAGVFRMLLRFIYGGEIPGKNVLKEDGRNIIRAADRFGCTGLKLAAESEMAAADITIENAAELILFADATNCAMLKEAAMEYFVANAQGVMTSEGYKQVVESPAIMQEMVAAVVSGNRKRPADSADANDRDYKRMRVPELRRKLDSKSLDVDGSKEMLVSRLEAADEEERKKNSISISRAGIDDANGVYEQMSELSDGLPVYQKTGTWHERAGSFCLFRCRVSTNVRKWLISFVPDGHRPGTAQDVDFYSADHDDDEVDDDGGGDDSDANFPPEDGWNEEDEGRRPFPIVKKSEEK